MSRIRRGKGGEPTRALRPDSASLKRNGRALFVGATGSGKSTLMKALLHGVKNVMVIDPKRTFVLPESYNATITTDRTTVENWDSESPLIFRPGADVINDPFAYDWFFYNAYERENTLVVVDEVYLLVKQNNMAPGYGACIQLGRERGVGVWHATQRPSRVPINIISESEDVFAFRLRNPNDQERIAEYTDYAIMNKQATGHGFWHYNDARQELVYYERAIVGKSLE